MQSSTTQWCVTGLLKKDVPQTSFPWQSQNEHIFLIKIFLFVREYFQLNIYVGTVREIHKMQLVGMCVDCGPAVAVTSGTQQKPSFMAQSDKTFVECLKQKPQNFNKLWNVLELFQLYNKNSFRYRLLSPLDRVAHE